MHTGWDVDIADGAPVRFEIGMRWGSLWRLAAAPWVGVAFLRMLRPPGDGSLIATRLRVTGDGPALVQRWRDLDAVGAWSRDPDAAHLEGWRRFAEQEGGTSAWGIWHRLGSDSL